MFCVFFVLAPRLILRPLRIAFTRSRVFGIAASILFLSSFRTHKPGLTTYATVRAKLVWGHDYDTYDIFFLPPWWFTVVVTMLRSYSS